MNKKNIGFTLIELLVVIAIIGILSGLIIVSLGDATNQAKEAKIKSALDQLRPVAQLYYNSHSNSFASLTGDTKVANIYNDMVDNGALANAGAAPALTTLITSDATRWCAYAVAPTGSCMCVDGTGKVKTATSNTACTCATYACPN
ncbi:MAG: prepilin-type N-terminal cleavage/methylation domain-containing protein [Candidatus Pacebacteria bacterium]|nr:prepilin-type N-terminal cleavage/methylation domain-containing protein [Candidatus Paceibacterota bacterium]